MLLARYGVHRRDWTLHFLRYAIPTFFFSFQRVILSESQKSTLPYASYTERFMQGPFHLVKISHLISVLWIMFISQSSFHGLLKCLIFTFASCGLGQAKP